MKNAILLLAVLVLGFAGEARAQSLEGSEESIGHQYLYALSESLPFMETETDLWVAVAEGYLIPLLDNENYVVVGVRFPYVLASTIEFVDKIAFEYRLACGEKLVITSAVRPRSYKLENSHVFSVHPTGMTVDLRVPKRACRRWLEKELLGYELAGVLDATLETNPWHYHVPVFPAKYREHLHSTEE